MPVEDSKEAPKGDGEGKQPGRKGWTEPAPAKPKGGGPLAGFMIILAFIAALILFWMSAVAVDSGHVGVVSLFGDVEETTLSEGFHILNPFATVHKMSVRKDVSTEDCDAASSDLQSVKATVAVEYRAVAPVAWKLFREVGREATTWKRVIIAPATREVVKAVTARFTAENLVKEREKVKTEIKLRLAERLAVADLELLEINITNFGFSRTFDEAIESKVRAEQQALQAKNELERIRTESQQRIINAEADATAKRSAADATAYAIEAEAKAQAAANRSLEESLTEKVLRNRWLEKWDGILPKVMSGDSAGILIPIEGATK